MKNILILVSAVVFSLTGCVSQTDLHKTNVPNGKWVQVNPYGYVPPNTDVYFKTSQANGGVVDPKTVDIPLGNAETIVVEKITDTDTKGGK